MKKRVIEDKSLKKVGAQIMEAACLTDQEIEEIISKPSFFDSIATEIEREKMRREEVKISGGHSILLNLTLQKEALAFGGLLLFSIAFLGLFFLGKHFSSKTLPYENVISQAREQTTQPFENKLPVEMDTAQPPKAFDKKIKRERPVQKASLKESKSRQLSGELLQKKRWQSPVTKVQEEFYPLAFAAELNNADDGRHIVKAELSSKELNRMGLYLPLQNQDEVFKTELIISSDNVPLAVRFLKSF